MNAHQAATVDSSSESTRRRRSLMPRFSLRTLFVFAILFCLFFAWAGKHVYRVRQEQAAIEALKQAEAKFGSVRSLYRMEKAQPFENYDPLARLLGRTQRPSVRRVTLWGHRAENPKTDAAIAALALFPEIESLDLEGTAFDDASLAQLAGLTRLEDISLVGTDVTGAGIARLGQSAPIRALHLDHARPSAELIEGIASLSQLEYLALQDENDPVEPRAYAPLASARELKTLIARESGFDDEDMTTLAKLERLETLMVDGITDVGLARLDPLTKLGRVVLYHPVTSEAARKFSASHPECRVEHRDATRRGTEFLAGEIAP